MICEAVYAGIGYQSTGDARWTEHGELTERALWVYCCPRKPCHRPLDEAHGSSAVADIADIIARPLRDPLLPLWQGKAVDGLALTWYGCMADVEGKELRHWVQT